MKVSETFKATNRAEWRKWLKENGEAKKEIWLLYDDRDDFPTVGYLDSVEEAICFGWIDGIQKRININEKAQRFTPRKKNSNWTELNKARARRLVKLGLMTNAGKSILPPLDSDFIIPDYINEALSGNKKAKSNFENLPELYVRVRVGYIDEMRNKPTELKKRLENFISKTEQGKLYGNWNDEGRLSDDT